MYLIIGILIISFLITIFLLNRNYNKKINEIINDKNKEVKEEITLKKELLIQQYNNFEEDINKRKEFLDLLILESENRVKDSVKKEKVIVEKEIENNKIQLTFSLEQQINELKEKAYTEYNDFLQQIQQKTLIEQEQYNKLVADVEDFRNRRAAIIKLQKEEAEIKEGQSFYILNLTENDLEDIIELSKLEEKIHHKDIVNRLIFDVYIKKPLSDLCNRVLANKKICGIYKITNLKNDLIYIGKSTDVKNRWQEHIKSAFNIGTIAHAKIHDAIKKDGIQNFSFQLIEECSKEIYGEREKYWIDFYDTKNYGYNEKNGG